METKSRALESDQLREPFPHSFPVTLNHSENQRPFGLGFAPVDSPFGSRTAEIPSSEIVQSLKIRRPTAGACAAFCLFTIACLALGGIVMGVAYLSA